MAFTRGSHSKLCWVAWWICSWCWHCGLRRVSIWEAAKSSEQFSMWVTFSHGSVNLEYLEETADGRVGRERGKQGLQEAANTLKIFSIRIEARMQQSNANGKSALSGPHDHGIWNGLRHESVNFKYLSWKNGRMGGSWEAKEKRFAQRLSVVVTKWVPSAT